MEDNKLTVYYKDNDFRGKLPKGEKGRWDLALAFYELLEKKSKPNDRSFLEELQNRGYDVKTFKLEVEKNPRAAKVVLKQNYDGNYTVLDSLRNSDVVFKQISDDRIQVILDDLDAKEPCELIRGKYGVWSIKINADKISQFKLEALCRLLELLNDERATF